MYDSDVHHHFHYKFLEGLGLDGEDIHLYGVDPLAMNDVHPKVIEFEKEITLLALQQMAAHFSVPVQRGPIGQNMTASLFEPGTHAFKAQILRMEHLLQEMVAGLPEVKCAHSLFEVRDNPEDQAPLGNLRLLESSVIEAWESVKAAAVVDAGSASQRQHG